MCEYVCLYVCAYCIFKIVFKSYAKKKIDKWIRTIAYHFIECLLCLVFKCFQPIILWSVLLGTHDREIYPWNTFIKNRCSIRGSLNKFPDFFCMDILLIVYTWNSSPLWSNLLWLQSTSCTVPTSGRPHGNPLVSACQWPLLQPLSFQLSHNDSLWA